MERLLQRMSRLRTPVLLCGADGTLLFRNNGARRALRRVTGKRLLRSVEREDGGIVLLREGKREYPVLCLSREEGIFCFRVRSAEAAALLSADRLAEALPALHRVWDGMAEEALPTPDGVCRLVADLRLAEDEKESISGERFVGLTSLVCRLLFEEPPVSPAEEALLLTDPPAAFGVLGQALVLLLDAEAEGRSLRMTLRRLGESLFLDVMEESLFLGRCRIPTLAEAPEPFVFREEDMITAFALAAAAEITIFSDFSA